MYREGIRWDGMEWGKNMQRKIFVIANFFLSLVHMHRLLEPGTIIFSVGISSQQQQHEKFRKRFEITQVINQHQ